MNWFQASELGNPAKLKKLHVKNAATRDRKGWTALMYAASSNNVQNVLYLLEAEKGLHGPSNYTALMLATERGFLESARILAAS